MPDLFETLSQLLINDLGRERTEGHRQASADEREPARWVRDVPAERREPVHRPRPAQHPQRARGTL